MGEILKSITSLFVPFQKNDHFSGRLRKNIFQTMGNIAKFYPKMKISEQVKYANILVFKVTKTIFVKEFHSTYCYTRCIIMKNAK